MLILRHHFPLLPEIGAAGGGPPAAGGCVYCVSMFFSVRYAIRAS
jgi:hypothetical protein